MPKTVIVVPCYNEAKRLPVKDFLAFAESGQTTLLFVDDGSSDGTHDVLQELAGEHEHIEVLSLGRNVGKGEAVRRGLRLALDEGAEVVAFLDADLSTPIVEIERLLAKQVTTGADVVLGARVGLLGWDVHRTLARHYLGRFFATAASAVLRLRVYDTQCGAKVFARTSALEAALQRPFRSRWIFDVELLGRMVIEHRKVDSIAGSFVEVPLHAWTDVGGSKLRPASMLGACVELVQVQRDLSRWHRHGRGA